MKSFKYWIDSISILKSGLGLDLKYFFSFNLKLTTIGIARMNPRYYFISDLLYTHIVKRIFDGLLITFNKIFFVVT